MKRLLGLALGMLAAACLWTGCAERPVADWQRGFFIPMDGYCAMGEDETLTLALTYYIDAAAGGDMGEDVTAIALDGIEPDQLKVEMDEIAPMEPMNGHHGYSVTLQIAPAAQGVFETDGVILFTRDGGSVTVPLGDWVFDIGDTGDDSKADTWEAPMASSNAAAFAYDYKLGPGLKLTALQYGRDSVLRDEAGLAPAGQVPLEGDTPVKFIKTRLTLRDGAVAYGKGCYCGALGEIEV